MLHLWQHKTASVCKRLRSHRVFQSYTGVKSCLIDWTSGFRLEFALCVIDINMRYYNGFRLYWVNLTVFACSCDLDANQTTFGDIFMQKMKKSQGRVLYLNRLLARNVFIDILTSFKHVETSDSNFTAQVSAAQ